MVKLIIIPVVFLALTVATIFIAVKPGWKEFHLIDVSFSYPSWWDVVHDGPITFVFGAKPNILPEGKLADEDITGTKVWLQLGGIRMQKDSDIDEIIHRFGGNRGNYVVYCHTGWAYTFTDISQRRPGFIGKLYEPFLNYLVYSTMSSLRCN